MSNDHGVNTTKAERFACRVKGCDEQSVTIEFNLWDTCLSKFQNLFIHSTTKQTSFQLGRFRDLEGICHHISNHHSSRAIAYHKVHVHLLQSRSAKRDCPAQNKPEEKMFSFSQAP